MLLQGDAAEQVHRAVEASNVDLLTGRDDRLLRHLELVIDGASVRIAPS
jgi:hypothetical protein